MNQWRDKMSAMVNVGTLDTDRAMPNAGDEVTTRKKRDAGT